MVDVAAGILLAIAVIVLYELVDRARKPAYPLVRLLAWALAVDDAIGLASLAVLLAVLR